MQTKKSSFRKNTFSSELTRDLVYPWKKILLIPSVLYCLCVLGLLGEYKIHEDKFNPRRPRFLEAPNRWYFPPVDEYKVVMWETLVVIPRYAKDAGEDLSFARAPEELIEKIKIKRRRAPLIMVHGHSF